jgi:hypothetical protein
MTVAYLAPSLRLKSWLNNGTPNSMGTVATYQAGTTIPVATYTDSTATQPNLNPIPLNQRGEASVWQLPNVAYKYIEFDQFGNQLDSTDQVVNSQLITYYGTDSGFANNYILTAATPYTTYQNGQLVFFVAANTNTGPSTVNINGLGPIPITTITGAPLGAGQIVSGIFSELIYFNGVFQLLSIGNTFGPSVGTFGAEIPIASAATTDLGSTPNHCNLITGTTTITSFGTSAQTIAPIYIMRFAASLTITFNATSMILPGGASIVTMAGDAAIFEYLGSGNWKCMFYQSSGGQQNSKIKSGDTVQVSNTVLTADPDLQTNTLAVGKYSFEIFLLFDSVAGGAGFKWTNGGSATDSRGAAPALIYGFVNGTALGPLISTPYGTTLTYASVNTAPDGNSLMCKGSILVGSAGSFGVSWAQSSSTASATTLRAGSYLTTTLLNTGAASGQVVHTYNVAGTFIETIPTGFTTLTIEGWGSSAGGGPSFGTIGGNNLSGGGGASSGSYFRTTISVAGLGGETLNFVVGAAGAFAFPGNPSSVSSGTLAVTTMTAPGGLQGASATSPSMAGSGGPAPANATGGTVVNTPGNAGSAGQNFAGGSTGGQGGFGIPGINNGGASGGRGSGLVAGTPGGAGLLVFAYA